MAGRPYWSGQLQISLVSFGIKLFPAVESKSEIRFHQISRKTGERVRHQKVSSGGEEPVENEDIIKGYEYSKGQYIQIEPEELEHLRIASRRTLEVQQFVDSGDLTPLYFEKPYFVAPENDAQSQAFAVVRTAMEQTGKVGIGKISLGGRETLMAVGPSPDGQIAGMMAYSLRYAAELRNPAEYFAGIKAAAVDEDQLALAKELIKRKTAKFVPESFTDEYETALRELIDAKLKNLPAPQEEEVPVQGKVIDLMEALRRSVGRPGEKKPVGRVSAEDAAGKSEKHGIKLINPDAKPPSKRRKSA